MTAVYIVDTFAKNRSLDTRASQPSSLDKILDSGQNALTWTFKALQHHDLHNITYIGSYHIEKVIQAFPQFRFNWCEPKATLNDILETLNTSDENCLILAAHVLYLPKAIQLLLENKNVQGILGDEWAGYHFESTKLKQISEQDRSVQISLNEVAANTNEKKAVARLIMRGKGKALENIQHNLEHGKVVALYRIKVKEWQQNAKLHCQQIINRFEPNTMVVRSATLSEDAGTQSLAGFFTSVLNVTCNEAALHAAIDEVIASYSKGERSLCPNDEVLIQPQVCNLVHNGVIFTKHPHSGAPYYCLSVDSTPGSMDAVTSGSKNVDNYYIAWNTPEEILPQQFLHVIHLAKELMQKLMQENLDIEFGIDKQGELYLFQVRPLVVNHHNEYFYHELLACLDSAYQEQPEGVYGVMPDWNPAEMIGIKPKPLAFSLYHHFITENAWAKARAIMGYNDLRPHALMTNICGSPYINVAHSIHSFIPANVDVKLAKRWVAYCQKELQAHPENHDKIEFKLTPTCLGPNWPKHQANFEKAGLYDTDVAQFYQGYVDITERAIRSFETNTYAISPPSEAFTAWFATLENKKYTQSLTLAQDIETLYTQTKQNGIVPFSIYARLAFIGLTILHELEEIGVLSADMIQNFLQCIPTISSQFVQDQYRYSQGELSLADLIRTYGHLRPSSYEITARSYAQNPALFRKVTNAPNASQHTLQDALGVLKDFMPAIQHCLNSVGLNIKSEMLLSFIVKSIQIREQKKFEFMQQVNILLHLIQQFALLHEISCEEISFVPFNHIRHFATHSPAPGEIHHLRKTAHFYKKRWELTQNIILPELINNPNQLYCHQAAQNKANYITQQELLADICVVDNESLSMPNLDGKIALLQAADPGFDWVFSYKLKGLITAFGGMASHMAIRCCEFGLPAAIGCGIETFEKIKNAKKIKLDCQNQVIEAIYDQ